MNYLAHVYLSGSNADILAGNFMGDFVKGRDYLNYPENISNGMVLHRFIDSFTDQHEISVQMREKLRPYCGRYAGIALDMIYDYYLAKQWANYSAVSLEVYSQETYSKLEDYFEMMPQNCQQLYVAMRRMNWLLAYQSLDGIGRSMNGLDHRLGGNTGFPKTIDLLEDTEINLIDGFNRFFPELESACLEKIASFTRVSKGKKENKI